MYVVLSIDIGEKNLALLKEQYESDKLDKLCETSIGGNDTKRYDKNGEVITEFKQTLNKVYKYGKRVWHEVKDLTSTNDKKIGKRRVINNSFLNRVTVYLNRLNDQGLFNDVNYIVIEQQQQKASNNLQIQYHIRGYFIGIFSIFKYIICFPASHKTRVLGCPKEIMDVKKNIMVKTTKNKSYRKIWSSMRAKDILMLRGDDEGIEEIFNKRKKTDDISDCLLQSIAFVVLLFLDKKTELLE